MPQSSPSFMVKNNSSWFSMYDAEMNCGIEKIVTKKQTFEGFSVAPIMQATIGPEKMYHLDAWRPVLQDEISFQQIQGIFLMLT